MKKRVLSLLITLCMMLAIAPQVTYANGEETWYVIGNSGLCNGREWELGAEVNKMQFNTETGLYEITYAQVGFGASESEPFEFRFQVHNADFSTFCPAVIGMLSAQDDVKITFNSDTKEVSWYSDSAYEITNHVYRVVGVEELCGSSWNASDDNNIMTYNEDTGRYEKIYTNVAANANNGYMYKITVDGMVWIPDAGEGKSVIVSEDDSTVTIWYNETTGELGADVTGNTHECQGGIINFKKANPLKNGYTGDIVCGKCGTMLGEGTIIARPKYLRGAGTGYLYTGSPITPEVYVKDGKGNIIPNTNYEVEYLNNVLPGVGTVRVTFTGENYEGTMEQDFNITMPKTSIISIKNGSAGKMTVAWKKKAAASGYYVMVKDSSGKLVKSVKMNGTDARTATLSGLEKGKTYRVYVRTYAKTDGKVYYSEWSTAEKVTIEK